MRGVDTLRQVIIDHLAFELPRKIPLLRVAWDYDIAQLPDMDKIIAGETVDEALSSADDGAGTWAVVNAPRLARPPRPMEIDPAGRFVYLSRYSCQLSVWVRTAEWTAARSLRDLMTVACRLCLLEYPTLTSRTQGDSGYRLAMNSLTEQYGVPVRIRNKSVTWAGALVLFEVDAEETLADGATQTPLGEVDALGTTAEAVGPTQPMP